MRLAIMLDPGHGGTDGGAIANGVLEKDINWSVVIKTRELLTNIGFSVGLTRDKDENPTLLQRAKRAKQWGADLLISVHHNAGGGQGFEIYRGLFGEFGNTISQYLADEFKSLGQKPHGDGIFTKTMSNGKDYFGILRNCSDFQRPSILVEYAFLDSVDFEKINSEDKLFLEAKAITNAVCKLCGVDEPQRIAYILEEKGWSNNPNYWAKVMRGEELAKAEYIFALLKNIIE